LPNSAVTGAQVTLGPIGIGTLTSGDGSYRLVIPAESLPSARDLVLRVRRVGYSQVERTLKVRPTDSLRVDVSLCAQTLELDEVAVTGASASWLSRDASITNTQEAGVDEGGIVKLHGEHLVILRRGRLFTVAIGGDDLRPIAAVDAFGPGIDPAGSGGDGAGTARLSGGPGTTSRYTPSPNAISPRRRSVARRRW